jgi:phosphatidate cytidylyltransferase
LAAVALWAVTSSNFIVPVALVAVTTSACLWELRRLVSEATFAPLTLATGLALAIILFSPDSVSPTISIFLWAVGVLAVWYWSENRRGLVVAIGFAGWVAAGLGGALWLQNRTVQPGSFYSWSLALVALPCLWAGDSLAYFVGKVAGRHKLAPSISPGKTWEGAIAHFVGSTVCATLFGLGCGLDGWAGAACGAIGSVAGQAGDLLESKLKRSAIVKDSGDILPGHGGVLDRIDSMLVAVPPQVLFLWLVAPSMFHVKQ